MATTLRIHPDVRAALDAGRPVVALETAVLTHGLPRAPAPEPECCRHFLRSHRWDPRRPANVELALALAAMVREAGATPAMTGVLEGRLIIGLDEDEIRRLGAAEAVKLAARDLAPAIVAGLDGGTTVAGTLAALASARHAGCVIETFATGGIGGAHRGWNRRWDVSADLAALARAPVCVVSAGAKSILDLEATVEMLDTLGVPVLGLGTTWFPRFLTEGTAPLRVQRVVAGAVEAAALCRTHWTTLGASSGVLLANPPPARFALPAELVETTIATAVDELEARGIRGPEVTPHLLARLAEATKGGSVEANVAVLLSNAQVAAQVATELA